MVNLDLYLCRNMTEPCHTRRVKSCINAIMTSNCHSLFMIVANLNSNSSKASGICAVRTERPYWHIFVVPCPLNCTSVLIASASRANCIIRSTGIQRILHKAILYFSSQQSTVTLQMVRQSLSCSAFYALCLGFASFHKVRTTDIQARLSVWL